MTALKKLQAEIDKTLKKVDEGLEEFQTLWTNVQHATTSNQREKLEGELKSHIKKLQREREQIKNWLGAKEVKEKGTLLDARKRIETEMERFKEFERESKTKAFSKEGLNKAEKADPHEEEIHMHSKWIQEMIDALKVQNDELEADVEAQSNAASKKKKSAADSAKLDQLKVTHERHQTHIRKLEMLRRKVDNDEVCLADVEEVKDLVEFYVQQVDSAGFDFGGEEDAISRGLTEKYDMLNLTDVPIDVPAPVAKEARASEPEKDKDARESRSKEKKRKESVKEPAIGLPTTGSASPKARPSESPIARSTPSSVWTNPVPGKPSVPQHSPPPANGVRVAPTAPPSMPPAPPPAVKGAPMTNPPALGLAEFANLPPSPPPSGLPVVPHTAAPTGPPTLPPTRPPCAPPSQPPNLPPNPPPTGPPAMPPTLPPTAPPQAPPNLPPPTMFTPPSMVPPNFMPPTVAPPSQPPSMPSLQATPSERVPPSDPLPPPPVAKGPPTSAAHPPPPSVPPPPRASTVVRPPGAPPSSPPTVPNARSTNTAPGPLTAPASGSAPLQPANSQRDLFPLPLVPPDLKDAHRPPRSIQSPDLYSPDKLRVLKILDDSYQGRPTAADGAVLRKYRPRNPYVHLDSAGRPLYPTKPLPTHESQQMFETYDLDTLFFIFYYQQGTYQQHLAAKELKKLSWRYHTKYLTWFQRHEEPRLTTTEFERGAYVYFDYDAGWCQRMKTDFTFEYKYLEDEHV